MELFVSSLWVNFILPVGSMRFRCSDHSTAFPLLMTSSISSTYRFHNFCLRSSGADSIARCSKSSINKLARIGDRRFRVAHGCTKFLLVHLSSEHEVCCGENEV